MRKALAHTAAYDTAIAATLATIDARRRSLRAARRRRRRGARDRRSSSSLEKIRDLRYGENPHQTAAWYVGGRSATPATRRRPRRRRRSFRARSCRTRTCSISTPPRASCSSSTSRRPSVDQAHQPVRRRDRRLAGRRLRARARRRQPRRVRRHRRAQPADRRRDGRGHRLDVHRSGDRAGGRRRGARRSRAQGEHARRDGRLRPRCRAAASSSGRSSARCWCRSATSSVEAQQPWTAASLPDGLRVVTRRQPTAEEWEALRFAWRVCAHVKSNTVIFTDARRTLAIGAGQMSRVDAVNVAVMKARAAEIRVRSAGSVAASDAFFPFRDGLDAVAAAGRDRGRSAGRLGARRRSDRRRRRARAGDGVHRHAGISGTERRGRT